MKSCRRLGWSNPRVIAFLIVLGIALFSGAKVQAAPQYDLQCDACHRLPPLDSSGGREPATGAVKGNHQSHSGATGATCVKCHGSELTSTGLTSTGHRDKTIQVQGNINGSPLDATYSRGFINQTSVPPTPLGSCSNVNCHFEKITPTWGRLPKYVLPTDCDGCHATVPASGNHPTGGSKHGNYYGTGTESCKQCHPDHTFDDYPFRHATSAASRGIAVQFGVLPNAGGSYSGNGLNYLPSEKKTSFGNCASVYCHSNGIGGAPNTPAAWGGTPLSADCSGCHGGNANAAYKIGTGSHAQHINNTTALGTNYDCARCHNTTVSVGNDLAITTIGNHVDGVKTVVFNNGGGYSAGACSGTLCHATGNAAVPLATLPVWGGGALDCKGCHGAGSSFGEPNYANGGAAQPTANSHSASHVTGALSCVSCHANTTVDGVSIKSGSNIHTDGTNNVDFSGAGSYSQGAKSCSSIYCHSDGNSGQPLQTPVWGDAMPAMCVGCHGGDASVTPASSVINTYRHRSHMNNYSTLGRGQNLQCGECHATTVALGDNQAVTITGQAKHLNKFKDYSGGNAGRYDLATFVCSNLYCHSSGQAAPNNVFRNLTTSKAWNGTAKLDCNGCHGYGAGGAGGFTAQFGEPNYPSGGGGSATANSHKKHVLDANMTSSTGCVACHRTTVDGMIANKLRDYSSAHLNQARDVSFARLGNYTGHYNAGLNDMTCSNTYCHGVSSSAKWGAPGPLLCDSCHKASSLLPGHGKHWETATAATSYTALPGNLTGTATKYNFECSSCHNGSHANGPKGLNGAAVEVLFNYTAAGRKGSYTNPGATMAYDGTLQYATNGSCATTYCHSKGNGTEGFVAANWGAPDKSLRCNGCHGGDYSKANPINTDLHRNHLDPDLANSSLGKGNGRKCGECHAKTASFANNTTIIDKTKHVNKFRDYSGLLAGGSSSYDQKYKTCNNIYCHSNGKRDPLVNQYVNPGSWTATGGSPACNGCHGQASPSDFSDSMGTPNYRNQGLPGSDTSNSHQAHVQKMGLASTNACYVCHARTVDKYAPQKFSPYSTTHISDGATHVAFGRISTAGFKLMSSVSKASYKTGKTCSTVTCHSDGKGGYQDVQWGAPSNCAMCHPMNKLSRGHIFHVYTSAVNNPTFYNNYTANRSNKGAALGRYNYGCANCHPVNNPNHTKGTVLIDLRRGLASEVGLLRSRNSAAITTGAVRAGTLYSGTIVAGNTLTCANVYCHSNGYASSPAYATAPDWYNGSFTGDRCANCHGNAPNSTGNAPNGYIAGSPTHYNSNWLGAGGAGGHSIGIHSNTIANAVNFTGVLTAGSTDPSSHGQTPTVAPTTIGCNTCHYSVVTSSANNGSAQCAGCHTQPATQALATIADKSLHVNGTISVQFKQTKLFSKAQLKDASFALVSSVYMKRYNGYKAGTSYDASKTDLNAGSYAGNSGNCTTVCHFNKPVRWDNVPAATCSSCHSSL